MTIADVVDFYTRRDAAEATGSEEPCTGCDAKLEPGEPYSNYDIAGKPRTPRAFPPNIVLCQKCTYLVIAWRPPTPEV
jgi:hypothetical protein